MPRRLRRLLQVVVAAGLLALLWRMVDGAAALEHLAGARPGWLLAAVAALTAQTMLSALRWRLTAGRLGIAIGRWTAVREYYLGQIVNQTLPGGVLGDAGRAMRSRRDAGLLAAGQAVAFERLAGQVALGLLFAAAVAGTLAVPGGFDWPGWLLTPVLLAIGGAGAVVPVLMLAGARLPGRLGRAVGEPARAFMRATWSPGVRARQAGLSLGAASCNVVAFACCASAIGVTLPPATALALVPPILFTMLIPVTVSGWGLREGAAVALLPLAGASASEGMAASVAFGLAVLAAALPGVAAFGVGTRTSALAPRRPDPVPDVAQGALPPSGGASTAPETSARSIGAAGSLQRRRQARDMHEDAYCRRAAGHGVRRSR
ncbi:MAG TPA: lysylphosphatidylglycerol synthase transmembrane domain-containing protein [Paracoccaceae bacterium]|nr:lysylphosphatidylglycerol synthase transmembrane domain-containing protein [Paracoccaceae bacterium]